MLPHNALAIELSLYSMALGYPRDRTCAVFCCGFFNNSGLFLCGSLCSYLSLRCAVVSNIGRIYSLGYNKETYLHDAQIQTLVHYKLTRKNNSQGKSMSWLNMISCLRDIIAVSSGAEMGLLRLFDSVSPRWVMGDFLLTPVYPIQRVTL